MPYWLIIDPADLEKQNFGKYNELRNYNSGSF